MARPRKHLITPPKSPVAKTGDHRDAYLERVRGRLELYSAKEVAVILGIDQDAVYAIGLPGFNPGERRHRWDGFTLADYLDRQKTSNEGMAAYMRQLVEIPDLLSATQVARILGLHSDAVPFLGLRSMEIGPRRRRYSGTDLAAWLALHPIGGNSAD